MPVLLQANANGDQGRERHASIDQRDQFLNTQSRRRAFVRHHGRDNQTRVVVGETRSQIVDQMLVITPIENHRFQHAFVVLHTQRDVRLSFLRTLLLNAGQNAAELHFKVPRQFAKLIRFMRTKVGDAVLKIIQRMARDVKPDRLLLPLQRLHSLPVRHLRQVFVRCIVAAEHVAEQPALAGLLIPARLLPMFHRTVNGGEQLRPRSVQAIHGAGLNQRFNRPPVHHRRVHLFAEIEEVLERPVLLARGDDRFHRILAQILDGAQAEADRVAIGRERQQALIHIGRQNSHAPVAALVDVLDDLIRVARFRGQQRRHELNGVVRLQVRRDVSQVSVCRRVRLIKSVARKLRHQIEDLVGLLKVQVVLGRALQEACFLLLHLGRALLAHGAPQDVGLAQRVAGEDV